VNDQRVCARQRRVELDRRTVDDGIRDSHPWL
jgi:hypothetical protein